MIERYAMPEIKAIWDDENKYSLWKQIEILACEARAEMGMIPESDLKTIKEKAAFTVERVNEIELTTNHDVIAFLTNMAEYIGPASRHVHFGMTSSDVLDTALSCQMKQAGELILQKVQMLAGNLKEKAVKYKYTACIGRTHGVHAEPTTLGLKFLLWHQEILRDIRRLEAAVESIAVGQISGAVGTFDHLSPEVEEFVCRHLGLKPAKVTTQIIQRDRHAEFVCALAITGGTLEKIATEFRHLQKTEVLEVEEPFRKGQKGSSAMPHKRNPIICERIAGLARVLRGNAAAAMENMNLWHERDITHSSVERIIIPDSTMTLYYMLYLLNNVIKDLIVHEDNIKRNLELTRGLLFSQKILLKLTEAGLTREDAYSIVQSCAMKVWADKNLNMRSELMKSEQIRNYLTDNELDHIFNLENALANVDFIFNRALEGE